MFFFETAQKRTKKRFQATETQPSLVSNSQSPFIPGEPSTANSVKAADRQPPQIALPRRSCGETPGSKTNPGPGTCVLTISASNVEQQAASAHTSSHGKPEFELASSSNINSGEYLFSLPTATFFHADCNCQVPLSFPRLRKHSRSAIRHKFR